MPSTSRLIFVVSLVSLHSLGVPLRAADNHPLENYRFGTTFETGYLYAPLKFGDKITVHSMKIEKANGANKIVLTIDPNHAIFNILGDVTGTTKVAVQRVTATLKPIDFDDPTKKGRRAYEVEAESLEGRLLIVIPKDGSAPMLVVRDKEGRVESAHALRANEIPLEPCHPGCFPAGTLVETPDGVRKIETLKIGDTVLNVPTTGKPGPMKIASIFAGQSMLVEVETEKGKLITTAKQPLTLKNGEMKASSDLKAGDEIMRWQEGKPVATKVRGVALKDKPDRVFNLVLEKQGVFIANGYLVKSKPPVER